MQSPGEPWNHLFAWIEAKLGGRVVDYERQARWRPAFFIELERDGERCPLYFRGARPEIAEGAEAIAREARVIQELERGGVPVPHVYGICPEPCGVVMERSPGRANLATAETEDERRAALEDYTDILARMHELDIAPFEAMALERPSSTRELGLCDLARWESTYRKGKSRPEPLIEFVLGWLKRSVPGGRSRVSFLAVDAGQFLFDKGRVTALLDFELACLGDPAADLAAYRARDLSEPLGDIRAAYARYFERSGDTIPTSVIDYHTIRFSLYTPMAVAPLVASPMPALDLIQYLSWYWVYSLAPLEVMFHGMGLETEQLVAPDAVPTRESKAHDVLVGRLREASSGEDFAAYEIGASLRIAEYLRRAERYGPALETEDLAEASALLGRPVGDWGEADRLLEALVEEAGPERDAEFVRFFLRRARRQVWLLDPVLRELQGSIIQLLE